MRLSCSKRGVLIAIIAALVLALAAWAVTGCGGGTTTTTAAPATTTTAAPETTTSASTTGTTAGGGGTSGAIAVTGMVDNPTTLTVEALKTMKVETLTLQHPKKGPTEYTGVRFSAILDLVKVQATATTVVLSASDGFTAEVPLADIQKNADSLLVIGDDGTLSSAFPGLEGKTWVTDIVSMEFK